MSNNLDLSCSLVHTTHIYLKMEEGINAADIFTLKCRGRFCVQQKKTGSLIDCVLFWSGIAASWGLLLFECRSLNLEDHLKSWIFEH